MKLQQAIKQHETTKLVVLCKKQGLKLEKLKEKALYYTTESSLLERYDPVSEKKKELDGNKRKKRIEERDRQKGLR